MEKSQVATVVPTPSTSFTSIWKQLTQAHPSITQAEARQNARLLSIILVVTLVVGGAILAYIWITNPSGRDDADTLLATGAWFAAIGLYVANRVFAKSKETAISFILITTLTFVIGPFTENSQPAVLFFALVPILLAAIFFSTRAVLYTLGAVLVGTYLMVQTVEVAYIGDITFTVQFLIFASALLLAYMNHQQSLEEIRRTELKNANKKLLESEAVLEQRVKERTRDLEVAGNVSREASTTLELDKMLPLLTEATRSGFDLYHVAVLLYDAEHNQLNYTVGTGQQSDLLRTNLRAMNVVDDKGVIKRAAHERKAVIVNDVVNSPHYVGSTYLPETRAELAIPMIVGNDLIGVLDLQADQVDRFTDDDVKIMTTLAEQFAIAIENAQLYADQVKVADELRAIDNMKSQFLASMSHELRTPLNAILNFTEFMSMGMLGATTDKQVDALGKILSSGKHLLSLINDILDITKIEAGMMKLFIEDDLDLNKELPTIVATTETLIGERPVKLITEIADNLPIMVADKRRIRQILLNLLSNAAKFTEEGHVKLSVTADGDEMRFSISDTGPGIAPQEQSLVFEPFEQTETGIKHAGGTGLGLPISKRLAEAHGGSLWIESQLGQGATFHVKLPIRSEVLLAMIEMPEGA